MISGTYKQAGIGTPIAFFYTQAQTPNHRSKALTKMKAYRIVNLDGLYSLYKNGVVKPNRFEANGDSDAPSGCWSFWFDKPANYPGVLARDFLLEAEIPVEQLQKSIMTFRYTENGYRGQVFSGIWRIHEFICESSVSVKKITMSADTLKYLDFSELEISGEEQEEFKQWIISVIETTDNFYPGDSILDHATLDMGDKKSRKRFIRACCNGQHFWG